MEIPLNVLIVDDSEDDAVLLLRELVRGGYEPRHRRVDNAGALNRALDDEKWDIVLGDFTMPSFSGHQALSLVRGRGLDVPFIFVSGTMGEEAAVAAMKAGAQDYVIKGNLGRLVPAIERELRDAGVRREAARAEQTLRKLFHAVDNSANFVLITDASGVIEYVNPRLLQVTGYSADQVIGQKPSIWKSDMTDQQDYARLWQTILAGNDWQGELVNRCSDGRLITVSAVISPIKDANGRVSHFIGIQEDITHRKDLERQLRQAQKMESVGQLTGGVAHDFNNLLAIIIGNLDLLGDELEGRSTARQLANDALQAGLRGAELTHRLLAFARHQPLNPRPFALNELVTGITDLLRRTLGGQYDIEMALADDLWPGLADPSQVESALTNLAINARDAMPGGGRLTIETANRRLDESYAAENVDLAPGDYVMLAVSDTGTGIPPAILDRVLEPFFTTKDEGKGTGLGLSMIYGFAKQSRGHLKIYSEVGHGTTVRLYLPRAASDAIEAEEALAEIAEGEPADATILLVEDNAEVRRTAVRQLLEFGYHVIEAEDALTALEALRDQRIDLLFTDVVMPGGMTGIDLAREARKLEPDLKILVTTGFAEASLHIDDEAGAGVVFLSKPYRMADLARQLRIALRGIGTGASGGSRLLVVDDEPDIGRFVCNVAKVVGYKARFVETADAFKAEYKAHSPDVVVLDLVMPGTDGVELLAFLAEERSSASVLLMSGIDERVRAAAQSLGGARGLRMVGIVPKPVRVAELKATLESLKSERRTPAPPSGSST
jgi:PAS domain S-box-containing protein